MTPIEGLKATFFPDRIEGEAAMPVQATITKVWSDTCVNLEYIEIGPQGDMAVLSPNSVLLLGSGMEQPSGYYCVLVDEQVITATDVGDLGAVLGDAPIEPPVESTDTVLHNGAPPVDNAHVAPGAEQFVESTAEPVRGIVTLAEAQALPVLEHDDPRECAPFEPTEDRHITAFIAEDGRTMRVVHVEGELAALPVEA